MATGKNDPIALTVGRVGPVENASLRSRAPGIETPDFLARRSIDCHHVMTDRGGYT